MKLLTSLEEEGLRLCGVVLYTAVNTKHFNILGLQLQVVGI